MGIASALPRVIGAFGPAKLLTDLLDIGQTDERTLDAQQAQPPPATNAEGAIGLVDLLHDGALVEFNKGGVLEFLASLTPGRGRDALSPQPQSVEKSVQVELNGTHCFLQYEDDRIFQSHQSMSSEVGGAAAMAALERFVLDELARGLNDSLFYGL